MSDQNRSIPERSSTDSLLASALLTIRSNSVGCPSPTVSISVDRASLPSSPELSLEQAFAGPVSKTNVAKALNSKPQRGKKRHDLNDRERQELTRTRNREHAKSTRLRKKLRYEELIVNEQKFFDIQGKESLKEKRRSGIVAFFEARSKALMSGSDGSLLNEIVSSDFEFESDLQGSTESESALEAFDEILQSRSSPGSSSEPSIAFDIQGGLKGIAFSDNDSAFLEIIFRFKNGADNVEIENTRLRGLVRATFIPEQSLLKRLVWITIMDESSSQRIHPSSHPSVVSLQEDNRPDVGMPL